MSEEGRPDLDMAHVVCCLNKLDAGSTERICLFSRQQDIVFIASYAEIKRSLKVVYEELRGEEIEEGDSSPPPLPSMPMSAAGFGNMGSAHGFKAGRRGEVEHRAWPRASVVKRDQSADAATVSKGHRV